MENGAERMRDRPP